MIQSLQKLEKNLNIFQSKEQLEEIKTSLEFYKIRTKCTLGIVEDERYIKVKINKDTWQDNIIFVSNEI